MDKNVNEIKMLCVVGVFGFVFTAIEYLIVFRLKN